MQTFYQRYSNACGLVEITYAFQRYIYVILHLEITWKIRYHDKVYITLL